MVLNRGICGFLFVLGALIATGRAEAQDCLVGEVEAFGSATPPNLGVRIWVADNSAHPKLISNLANALNFGLTCTEAHQIKAMVTKSRQTPQETVVYEDVPYTAEDFELLKKKQIGQMTGEEFQAVQANDFSKLKKRVQRTINATPEIAEARKQLGALVADRLKKARPDVKFLVTDYNGSAVLGGEVKFNWSAGCGRSAGLATCSDKVMLVLDASMGEYTSIGSQLDLDELEEWLRRRRLGTSFPPIPRPQPQPDPAPWMTGEQTDTMIEMLQQKGYTVTQ